MEKEQLMEIVRKAMQGDKLAFEELSKEKGRSIVYMAAKLMGNYHDGEDVAQEVIIRIYKNITKLQNPLAFNSWMYQIVMRECTKARRKTKIKEGVTMEQYFDQLDETRRDFLPYEYAEDTEKRTALSEIVDELPYKCKACILLFYYEGLTYAEIATALEISEKDVANTLLRAKKLIKKMLEKKSDARTLLKGSYAMVPLPVLTQVFQTEAGAIPMASVQGVVKAAAGKLTIAAASQGSAAATATGVSTSVKAILAIAASTVVATAGITGYISAQQEQNNRPIMAVTETAPPLSSALGIQSAPQQTVAEAEEGLDIQTLEDMIGIENANLLRNYTANGVGKQEFIEFVEKIGIQFQQKDENLDTKTTYSLYTITKKNKLLMIVEKAEANSETVGIAYKFTNADERIPTHGEIPKRYVKWQ